MPVRRTTAPYAGVRWGHAGRARVLGAGPGACARLRSASRDVPGSRPRISGHFPFSTL